VYECQPSAVILGDVGDEAAVLWQVRPSMVYTHAENTSGLIV